MLVVAPVPIITETRETALFRTTCEREHEVERGHKVPAANAAIIGEVVADHPGKVVMTTEIGAQSLLPQPGGELLPRIC